MRRCLLLVLVVPGLAVLVSAAWSSRPPRGPAPLACACVLPVPAAPAAAGGTAADGPGEQAPDPCVEALREIERAAERGPAAVGEIQRLVDLAVAHPFNASETLGAIERIDPPASVRIPSELRLGALADNGINCVEVEVENSLLKSKGRLVPFLLPALEDPEARTRRLACKLLVRLGPDGASGASVVSALTKTLASDTDEAVRAAAAVALSRLAPDTPGIAEELVLGLDRGGGDLSRGDLAEALISLGPRVREAADRLSRILFDPSSLPEDASENFHGPPGWGGPDDPDRALRPQPWVVRALEATGDPEFFVPLLLRYLESGTGSHETLELAADVVVRHSSDRGGLVRRLAGDLARPCRLREVKSTFHPGHGTCYGSRTLSIVEADEAGSFWAARALRDLGPRAAPAIPALARALRLPGTTPRSKNDTSFVAIESAETLAALGEAGQRALARALVENDADLRRVVVDALIAAKALSPSAAAVLSTVLQDPSSSVRRDAVLALIRHREENAETMSVLDQELTEPGGNVHQDAIWLDEVLKDRPGLADAIRTAIGPKRWARLRDE